MFYYRQVIAFRPDSRTAYLNLGLLQVTAKAQLGRSLGLYELHQAMKLDPWLRAAVPAALRTAAEHAQAPKGHLPSMRASVFTASHDTRYLDATYRSLRDQSFDWEWIVVLTRKAPRWTSPEEMTRG